MENLHTDKLAGAERVKTLDNAPVSKYMVCLSFGEIDDPLMRF